MMAVRMLSQVAWASLVCCCCLEWEPCSCSVLSHSHDFTIDPFLAVTVLLFDTTSLFNPWKWQKTPRFPAWSGFVTFWCSHTVLALIEQTVMREEVARRVGETLPGGPLYCSPNSPGFSCLCWGRAQSTWHVSLVVVSKQGAGAGTGRSCIALAVLLQKQVRPSWKYSHLLLQTAANTNNNSLCVYLRKSPRLLLSLQLRREPRIMLRRVRVVCAGGTGNSSSRSSDAFGGHGGVLCKRQSWEAFVLRVHVEFAVQAAQKVYFDLQMATFYMQITEKR